VDTEQRASISETLSHHFSKDSDSSAIAGVLVRDFRHIDGLLTPILGQRGVALLFQRSLRQAGTSHRWLGGDPEPGQAGFDLDAVKASLEARDGAEAKLGATALLRAFHDLLASLIGQTLTERLLGPVWTTSPTPPSAQDDSP
jgi:hypothetical protein